MKPEMKDKINMRKKRISDSIEEGITALKSNRKSMNYDPLIEDLSEDQQIQNY